MRARELVLANVVGLCTGLALFFAFRPPHAWPLLGLVLAGMTVVQVAQRRRPPADDARGPVFRLVSLVLNGLYGSFFAVLAYFVILAFSRQIGYPYR